MKPFRFFLLSAPVWFVVMASGCSGTPASNPGSADLAAADLAGVDLASPDLALLGAAPGLDAMSPALGPTAGGVVITVDGTNFQPGATLTIAGAVATQVSVVSATRITALLPAQPGAWGKVAVVVKNPDGQTVSRSDLFAYYASQLGFPNRNLTAGTSPFAVAQGDLNGDKHPDLVVSNEDSNDVSVLLGNGAGGFSSAVRFATGTRPHDVTIGDLNGDKNPDLAVVNYDDASISVLLNDGKGSFAAAVNFPVGVAPHSILIGDFNDDLGSTS